MSLLRFLGIEAKNEDRKTGETATVRAIASRLERLDPELSRFLAGFAYVLARVANADLEIAGEEADEMRRVVHELAELGSEETDLVVEIAKSQARLLGGTENYVVTREFREHSTRPQRVKLLECLYAVAAADGTISGPESGEIRAIAEELGFTRAEANAYRSHYRDKLSLLRRKAK
ncbi:MAG: TerB family tellurite resistance protein [bacterium]|nr:TerB family tellurite resistance protein [bacterium]